MIKRTILIMLILLMCLVPVVGQGEITHPFECLPEFEALHHIEGRGVYVGKTNTTPAYWDVPEDTEWHGGYNNKWIDTYRFWRSDSADEYYVFVHNTSPVQEQDPETGEDFPFLSWHPCGQGAITPEQYEQIRERVNNDD